jgi:hypothetical protein
MWSSLILSLLFALLVDAECYDPIGTDTNERRNLTSAYNACDSTKTNGMCCRTGVDTCRSDGLCLNNGQLWRESCTDKTWNDPNCLKLCVSGSGMYRHFHCDLKHPKLTPVAQVVVNQGPVDMAKRDVMIKTCDNGSLCCGASDSAAATSCCQRGEGVWIVNNQVVSTNPSMTSTISPATHTPASSTSATNTPTTSTSPSATPASTDSGSKNNTGVIVGAVLGSIGGLSIIVAGMWFFWRRRKASTSSSKQDPIVPKQLQDEEGRHPPVGASYVYAYKGELPDTPIAELYGGDLTDEPGELPAVEKPRELLANNDAANPKRIPF